MFLVSVGLFVASELISAIGQGEGFGLPGPVKFPTDGYTCSEKNKPTASIADGTCYLLAFDTERAMCVSIDATGRVFRGLCGRRGYGLKPPTRR